MPQAREDALAAEGTTALVCQAGVLPTGRLGVVD